MKKLNYFKPLLLVLIFLTTGNRCFSQVGISTTGAMPDASAILDANSTTKGVLISRMTTAQRDAIGSPAIGLQVYNTTTNCFEFWAGGAWVSLGCAGCTSVPAVPAATTHVPAQTQIVWNWNTVADATGYKWNTANDYSTATDNGTSTDYAQTSLTCNTAYTLYVWAYNACGNSVAATFTQTTSDCVFACGTDSVSDIDGNTYSTVSIGTQCWMQQNLKTTKFSNNTAIPNVTDNSTWAGLSTPAYCCYNNDCPANNATYGKLYNWHAVADANGLCPAGWHVPTDAELTQLTDYLGGASVAGGKMKSTGTSLWSSPNTGADNSSGFTAVPGGARTQPNGGNFTVLGSDGYYWSSTNYLGILGWFHGLSANNASVNRIGDYKADGFSVRCLKD